MKKLLSLLLGVCLLTASIFLLGSCNNSSNSSGDQNNSDTGNNEKNESDCLHPHTVWKVIDEITCTKDGKIQKICADCGANIGEAESIKANGHNSTVILGAEATCIDSGLTDGKKCSKCNEVLEEQVVIPAKGHVEVVFEGKEPTCTEPGFTDGKKCFSCNETLIKQEIILPTGHTEQTIPGVEATCTEMGLTEGTECSICKEILVNQIKTPLNSHSYDNGFDDTCNVCGFTRDVSCHHSNLETIAGKNAACTEPGLTTGYKCLDCDEIVIPQTIIDAIGHKNEIVPGKNPTCTKDGLTEGKKCSVCGLISVNQEVIYAEGHKESEWIIDSSATCATTGIKYKECSVCKVFIRAEIIPVTDHNYVDDECIFCGHYIGNEGVKYSVILRVDNSYITDVIDGDVVQVTLSKKFKLPVPVSTDESKGFFVGWFNAPNGGGLKLTDDFGNATEPYGIIGDSMLYPYFAQAINYTEVRNDKEEVIGYYATKGLGITNKNVTEITIPATYNGLPVIGIADNAFNSCYNIISINIPNTIEYVGVGAFELCTKLLAINMYEAVANYNTPYSTYNDALTYYDAATGKTHLEVFPIAKTGEYTVPEEINVISTGAFNRSKLSKIIISKNVTLIENKAFDYCNNLTEIEFEFGRTSDIVIEGMAFYDVPNVTKITLPAKLAMLENIKMFDKFENLATIEVEVGGTYYSSLNNLICDNYGTKILYAPKTISGTFEVPLTISAIGDNAFSDNKSLTKLIIGEHVATIGSNAFYGCTALAEVVVKSPRESLFTIGTNAFNRCSNLKRVTFEGSDISNPNDNFPIYVDEGAFAYCSKLSTVSIGENVMIYAISAGSFSFCTSLETFSVDTTASLKNIGNEAFKGCSKLTKFDIHGSTVSIGDSAFEDCSKLSIISLGEGSNGLALGADVFKNCVRLVTIELPSTLTAFDPSLFDGCENIQNVIVDENNTYLESVDGVLYTKGQTEIIYYPRTKTITGGVVDLTSITALKKIGPSVFKNNPQVVTVKIGASVEEIAKNAFENCINLTSVEFTGTNANFVLCSYAFAGCSKLTSFELPESTQRIGNYAFDHSALASFTIPATVNYIGYNAFAYTNIETINIPASVTFIGHGAFYHATKLATVTFDARTADIAIGGINAGDEALVEVKKGTFVYTALTSIDIPATATYIGQYAFNDLKSLTTVTIPADAALETIDVYAFYGTPITSINFNEGLTTIADYAFANTKLTSVYVPKSVQYIKGYAFSIATLTNVTFEEGSNEGIGLHISNGAFVGTNLTSIHLPAQLKAFGEADEKYGFSAISVFYGLDVKMQSSERSVDIVFNGNMNLASITVSPENIVFGTVDGVLYKLQSTVSPDTGLLTYVPVRLLFSPKGNLGNNGTVTVPKTVTMVDYTSFLRTQLTQIIFEEYEKDDSNYGLGTLTIGCYDESKTFHLFPGVITSMYDETKSGNDRNHTNLTLIQFPSHLSKINYGAFYGITSYSYNRANATINVKFNPDSTVKFGASSFRASTAIKSIELPKVTYISQMAFYQLSEVTSITFAPGSTATSVGDRAFADCSKLTEFELPASIKIIEQMAFMGCYKLESFTVEEGSVLESISAKAFQNLGSQVEGGINFVIPASVKTVGTGVFTRANIVELTLSVNLELDANGSLIEGCTTIEKIHVPGDHPTLSSFDGIVYDKYQTAIYMIPSNWNEVQFIIPDTVQVIGASMFANFKGSYIKLPAALTAIADKAFQYAQITHIEIPDNVISIGDCAFNYCEKLTTITISNNSNLKYIGAQAFANSAITAINLPDSVETIGYSAFGSCSDLKYFKSPAKLTSIENATFMNCTALATIELNEGLETIGNNAFQNCAITSIIMPNSVTRILDYAFNGCKNLKTFYCSDASILNYVGFSCFNNCTGLETVTFGPILKNFGYNFIGAYNTFAGCTSLREINLPREMTEIPDGFFKGLKSIKTVTLPTSLEEIGIEAFYGCTKLSAITLPATLTTVGEAAFAKCTALSTVVFENGSVLKEIPAHMFAECTALTGVTLPESLITIGNGAFAMTGLTEITLPSALEEIGGTAFYGCESLTAVNVPASVIDIGTEAFANCTELASLTLNSGLKHIGSFAFANCSKITSATLPASLTTLEGNPFLGCADIVISLDANNTSFIYENGILLDETGTILIYYSPANTATSFTLPLTVTDIAAGAFANSKLETLVLHERIKVITTFAFAYSESLKGIVIPGSVTSIEDSAFAGCSSIESITIPASVLKIGNYAFANCTSLSTFTLADRKYDITVGSHLFYGCASITKTYEFPGVTDYTPYMYAGTGVTSVVFADNTNYNVEGVFADSALESVTFGKLDGYMNMLGKSFFAGTKLTSITVAEGFYRIGEAAFKDCENLVSVTISSNTIEDSAFENCTALTTVTVVKPSYVDDRYEFTIILYDRAFANAVSLSNTNMFEFVHSYGAEALLNCSAITGEISLSKNVNLIDNYAFSGMTVSKITLNGREYWLTPYALAGLTQDTTVYFATATSVYALVERLGTDVWYTNATAKIEFYSPYSDNKVEAFLTDEEEKWLESMVEKGEIDKSMMDSFKEAWLAYKASFVTLYPADSLTKDEVGALDEFANNFKIDERLQYELENLWIDYRMTLAKELTKHPKYFTADELAMFDEIMAKGVSDEAKNALKQMWFEYKINFNETNPSDEITKEEMSLIYDFCDSLGISEDFANELINRWPEYKKQLAAELATANHVYINLTDAELKALEYFCGNWGIKDGMEDIKLAWMAYKGALKIEGKGDAAELTAEEEALVDNMVATYGIEPKVAQELKDILLDYKRSYAVCILENVLLTDDEYYMIENLIAYNGLDKSYLETIEEDLLAYKKAFFLSEFVPGKELSKEEENALLEFLDKYGLDYKLAEEYAARFIEYRINLYRS